MTFYIISLKIGGPPRGVVFYSPAEFRVCIAITLQCADSPDLCGHVSKHDGSVLEKKKEAGQLNSKQRKKTSHNKGPEDAGVQGR